MGLQRHVARDISYASSAKSKSGRAFIRAVENLTGRPRLIRRVRGYDKEIAQGRNFWDVMVERYELGLNVLDGSLENIPKEGPLVVVSNHPYGILDGMMLGYVLSQTRGDFRILANSVFKKAEDLDRIILPISFDENREAVKLNLETRKVALNYLRDGGCIGIFPGGTVSTSISRRDRPMDPAWRSFTAKLVAKSGATVVPIFFDGANGSLFQRASRLNVNLRMALLINEFRKRVGDTVDVVIGEAISSDKISARSNNPTALMDFLRQETYRLSPTPLDNLNYGYEFEDQHR